MEEIGRIKMIKGRHALVEIKPTTFCRQCGNQSGCAVFNSSGTKLISAKNPIGAKEGEWVKVVFSERKEVLSSIILFLFPVFALIIGVILAGILGGIISFGFAFFLLRMVDNYLLKKEVFLPEVVSVIKEEEK